MAVDHRARRGSASAAAFAAYTIFPHVAGRIDRFLTGEGDTFQVDMGREAIIHGGWFGVGPGEGTVKRVIPDSHADFVFSVAGEEFGIVLCLLIMFDLRLHRAARADRSRSRSMTISPAIAVAGLVVVFGFQSIINMARQPAADAGQGHDAAVHLLWRLVA